MVAQRFGNWANQNLLPVFMNAYVFLADAKFAVSEIGHLSCVVSTLCTQYAVSLVQCVDFNTHHVFALTENEGSNRW